jgi:hypothetical protein
MIPSLQLTNIPHGGVQLVHCPIFTLPTFPPPTYLCIVEGNGGYSNNLTCSSFTGEIDNDKFTEVPSFFHREVSKSLTRPLFRTLEIRFNASSTEPGEESKEIDWPMISSGVYPNTRSAPLFQLVTIPFVSSPITAQWDEPTILANSRTFWSSSLHPFHGQGKGGSGDISAQQRG